jgi:hypothetical protein
VTGIGARQTVRRQEETLTVDSLRRAWQRLADRQVPPGRDGTPVVSLATALRGALAHGRMLGDTVCSCWICRTAAPGGESRSEPG